MASTRDQMEKRITDEMQQEGLTRQEAIDELLAGAEKGARQSEKQVILAQEGLKSAKTQEEVSKLEGIIASEGRFASLEREQIAWLNQIAKEDAKRQQ